MIFFVAKFQMNSRYLALAAAFIATTIYGINHTVAKEVIPVYIGSAGFIMLRLLGATALFWLISLFTPKEKIESKDILKIVFASILISSTSEKKSYGQLYCFLLLDIASIVSIMFGFLTTFS